MIKEYAIVKLGKIKNVDFFKEHKAVIDKFGYVDFAWRGRRIVNIGTEKGTFYIKESANAQNRLLKVTFSKSDEQNRHFPDYYSELDLSKVLWYRIETLKVIDRDEFLLKFTLRNGHEIKGLDSGAAPIIFIKERD